MSMVMMLAIGAVILLICGGVIAAVMVGLHSR